jgi:membrane-associated phospholipid phosphatase
MKAMIRFSGTLLCGLIAVISVAQQPDTLIRKLDSLSKKADSAGGQINNVRQEAYNENTKISFKTYFILLGSDFKQQITAPLHITKKDWLNVGKFAVLTAAVGLADESIQKFGLNQRTTSRTVKTVSNYVTNLGAQYEGLVLVGLAGYGFVFKNQKIKTTTLLATQAYITSTAMHYIVKGLTGRQRPSYVNPEQKEVEPTFRGPLRKPYTDQSGRKISSSFPSGHTTLAFSAATVYAMEYKDKPLVGIISYSAASLVGLSRITENKHWATDVLAGAALGYLCGRQVVNNYHRYAKLKSSKNKKDQVSFNLQYNYGKLMPGIIYTIN